MGFYERFEAQCQKKGVSMFKACKDLNISPTMIAKYRSGSIPRNSTIMDMATYFGCDIMELVSSSTLEDYTPLPPTNAVPTYQQFLSVMSMLDEREIKRVTNFAYQVLGERKN